MLLTYMYYILQFDLIVDSKSDKGCFKVIDCIVPSSEYRCPNTKWLIKKKCMYRVGVYVLTDATVG